MLLLAWCSGKLNKFVSLMSIVFFIMLRLKLTNVKISTDINDSRYKNAKKTIVSLITVRLSRI